MDLCFNGGFGWSRGCTCRRRGWTWETSWPWPQSRHCRPTGVHWAPVAAALTALVVLQHHLQPFPIVRLGCQRHPLSSYLNSVCGVRMVVRFLKNSFLEKCSHLRMYSSCCCYFKIGLRLHLPFCIWCCFICIFSCICVRKISLLSASEWKRERCPGLCSQAPWCAAVPGRLPTVTGRLFPRQTAGKCTCDALSFSLHITLHGAPSPCGRFSNFYRLDLLLR